MLAYTVIKDEAMKKCLTKDYTGELTNRVVDENENSVSVRVTLIYPVSSQTSFEPIEALL